MKRFKAYGHFIHYNPSKVVKLEFEECLKSKVEKSFKILWEEEGFIVDDIKEIKED